MNLKANIVKKYLNEIDYYQERLNMKQMGSLYIASCPFHRERTPSFRIYPPGFVNNDGLEQENSSFYCFGCSKGGDVIKFEQLYEQLNTYDEAIESLAEKYNIAIHGDEEVNELKENLVRLNNVEEKILSLTEINQICSSLGRKYLLYVKDNYIDKFEEEFVFMQRLYKKIDNYLLDHNAKECLGLEKKIKEVLKNRKKTLDNL